MNDVTIIWLGTCVAVSAVYFLAVRPILHALPVLSRFYSQADTFWLKLSALAWHSLTIAWSYVLLACSAVLQAIDGIGDAFGDPNLKEQISAAIGDAQLAGRVLLAVSVVNIVVRLRSIRKAQ